MTKQLEALIADLLRSAVKIGTEKWVSSNGEVTTEDYEADGVTYTDHICNCEVVNGESPRAEFIAKANPAVVMALIAALKQSQQSGFNAEALAQEERAENAEAEIVMLKERIAELESAITDHANSTHFCAVCGEDDPCINDDVCSVLTSPRLWKLIPETPPDDIVPKGRYVHNVLRRAAFIDGWKAARIAAGQGEDK